MANAARYVIINAVIKMYNIFTQWLTLSVIFFLADYITGLVDVVTLGGLVAGSFIIGAWTTLMQRASTLLPRFTGKALVVASVFMGVQVLCQVLPGYTADVTPALMIFLVLYSAVAVAAGNYLKN